MQNLHLVWICLEKELREQDIDLSWAVHSTESTEPNLKLPWINSYEFITLQI